MKDLTMNKSVIALLLLTTSAAFANEAADEQANRAAFGGGLTRAEVNAGVTQAQRQGTLRFDEYTRSQQNDSTATRSRTEVRVEAVKAARSHAVHELY